MDFYETETAVARSIVKIHVVKVTMSFVNFTSHNADTINQFFARGAN